MCSSDLRKLLASVREIELTFQMVHTGLQKRFAMQLAPQSNGAKLAACVESVVGKISGNFARRQVDIREDHNPTIRLFQHLGSPLRIATAIKTLATPAAKQFQNPN